MDARSTRKLPDFQSFFNWHTIFYFWCSLAVIKVIHEFGHGLTAKHFGGEVHEMGMLFLVLTPALYCDVTDSWLLPSKWKRIWISAAGIYVECFLASIATFVWWNTEQGLLNSLCWRRCSSARSTRSCSTPTRCCGTTATT